MKEVFTALLAESSVIKYINIRLDSQDAENKIKRNVETTKKSN